jgi:hypothetical protein
MILVFIGGVAVGVLALWEAHQLRSTSPAPTHVPPRPRRASPRRRCPRRRNRRFRRQPLTGYPHLQCPGRRRPRRVAPCSSMRRARIPSR